MNDTVPICFSQVKNKCDVAFIVALPEEEEAMDIFLDQDDEVVHNELDLIIRSRQIDGGCGRPLKCLFLLLNEQGPEYAGITTAVFLQHFRPSLIVVIGISGKISADVSLGSVVIADRCDNSLYRAKKINNTVLPGGREWPLDVLSRPLSEKLRRNPANLTYAGLSEEVFTGLRKAGYLSGDKPSVIFGAICSSTYLVDDPEFGAWIKHSRNRNLLALDMESAAIIQAAHHAGVRNGRILVIRGISDPADGRKKDIDGIEAGVLRRIAMRNASHVSSHIISHLLTFYNDEFSFRDKTQNDGTLNSAFSDTIQFLEKISDDLRILPETDACKKASDILLHKSASFRSHLNDLAQSAYQIDIRREPDANATIISLIPTAARDYLVATWVMKCLSDKNPSPATLADVLSNVYPHRVNRFCKVMLNRHDEKRIVDVLIATYEKTNQAGHFKKGRSSRDRAKAHICYLLGRVESTQQRRRAIDALLRWRDQLAKKVNFGQRANIGGKLGDLFSSLTHGEHRLLLRTISISLIMLEHQGEAENYVRACLRNSEFDSLNRGFHLEYYGDIDYDPAESMNNEDHLAACEKTFSRLYSKIIDSLEFGNNYPLRDIEVQTILSISQHRLAKSCLSTEHREALSILLEKYQYYRLTQIGILQSYCRMVREHLADDGFKRFKAPRHDEWNSAEGGFLIG